MKRIFVLLIYLSVSTESRFDTETTAWIAPTMLLKCMVLARFIRENQALVRLSLDLYRTAPLKPILPINILLVQHDRHDGSLNIGKGIDKVTIAQ